MKSSEKTEKIIKIKNAKNPNLNKGIEKTPNLVYYIIEENIYERGCLSKKLKSLIL